MLQIMFEQLLAMGLVFGMGLTIAISPCLFPLLPLFLIKNLQGEESRLRSLIITGILVAGIIVSFAFYIIITDIIFEIGSFFIGNDVYLSFISFIIIIILGIFIASHRLREIVGLSGISLRTTPGNPKGLIGVFGIGFTYAIIAAPCTGSIMLPLFGIIGSQTDPFVTLIMYLVLCIAVAIPYFAIAIVTGEVRIRIINVLVKSQRKMEIAIGVLLICVGLYFIIFESLPYLLS